MQFYSFNNRLKCITKGDKNYTSHLALDTITRLLTCWLFQIFPTSPAAWWCCSLSNLYLETLVINYPAL